MKSFGGQPIGLHLREEKPDVREKEALSGDLQRDHGSSLFGTASPRKSDRCEVVTSAPATGHDYAGPLRAVPHQTPGRSRRRRRTPRRTRIYLPERGRPSVPRTIPEEPKGHQASRVDWAAGTPLLLAVPAAQRIRHAGIGQNLRAPLQIEDGVAERAVPSYARQNGVDRRQHAGSGESLRREKVTWVRMDESAREALRAAGTPLPGTSPTAITTVGLRRQKVVVSTEARAGAKRAATPTPFSRLGSSVGSSAACVVRIESPARVAAVSENRLSTYSIANAAWLASSVRISTGLGEGRGRGSR